MLCLLIATQKSKLKLFETYNSVKMLASSNVNIGVIASNCLKPERAEQNVRRNYLVLFDSANLECVKMDVSIGVSLVDRDKESQLKDRV